MKTIVRVPGPTRTVCVDECRAKCCRTPASRLRMNTVEMRRLKGLAARLGLGGFRFLNVGRDQWKTSTFAEHGGQCVFLSEEFECRIYADRPECCARYPHRPVSGCLLWPGEGPVEVGPLAVAA